MFNIKLKPVNYLYNVLVLVLLFAFAGMPVQYIPLAATAGGLATGVLLGFAGELFSFLSFAMAVQKEIWENDIEEQIFKDNQFVRLSFRADEYVNGRAVHIPQSGGAGSVVKNRGVLPANVRKRTDTDVIYLIDEYTTDPVLIPNADTVELSYDKRSSVLGEDKNKLSQTVAEEMIYNWLHDQSTGTQLPATSIIKTTGAAVPATAPGATGYRKAATRVDKQTVQTKLINQNRWFEGQMNSLLPANMRAQMYPANDQVTALLSQNLTEEERRKGYTAKDFGFGILVRSSVVIVRADGTIKAPGAAGEAGDCEAALYWYTLAVETAYGATKMFDQNNAPQFYGDVYSFLVRMGGRARRNDFAGIVLLVQDTAVAP